MLQSLAKIDFKYHELTPIEQHEGVLFKRDDTYDPYGDFGITGGKVRQCTYLVESHLDYIRGECDGTIATAASVFSPQATIVARVAKHFGLKCIIGMGSANPEKHKAMRMCAEMGAELITLATANTYNNLLYAKLKELNETRKFFTINFGYQAKTDADAILDMNANQVKNLPKELDYLVIPLGSAVSACGIITGLQKYRKELLYDNRLILIQPFGYDRRKTINETVDLDFGQCYDYHMGEYNYHTPLKIKVGDVQLDDIYESKAYDYMTREVSYTKFDNIVTVFWLIGDSNVLRT